MVSFAPHLNTTRYACVTPAVPGAARAAAFMPAFMEEFASELERGLGFLSAGSAVEAPAGRSKGGKRMHRARSGSTAQRHHIAGMVIVMALCIAAVPCRASSIAPADVAQTIGRAATVVHATAVSSTSHWNESRTLGVTDRTYQVHEPLKRQST